MAIESFFVSYRESFERGDVPAVVAHFGECVHVASDTGAGVRVDVATGAEWRAEIAAQEHLVRQDRWIGGALAAVGVVALVAFRGAQPAQERARP